VSWAARVRRVANTKAIPAGNQATDASRCPGCQRRDATIVSLRQRIRDLERRLQRERERSGRNATNSSLPPSQNPVDAPKPGNGKKSSGRQRGGQPGHPPTDPGWIPLEELSEPPIVCIPQTCGHCHAKLSGTDEVPVCHQVIELPPIVPEIREYHRHLLTCAQCGQTTGGQLPDGVPEGGYGPRLEAFIALCTGCYHLSKRQVEELLTTTFNIPICLGTICNIEQRVSAAIADPVAEAKNHVQHADLVYADETSWPQQPDKGWLWAGLSGYLAVFSIRDHRDLESARDLLGADFAGVLISDRYGAYNWVAKRQLCWAHLRRDWQAFCDRGGTSRRIGERLQQLTDTMFHLWHRVRDGTLSRAQFRLPMIAIRTEVTTLLRQGAACAQSRTAGTCTDILKREAALWTFVDVPGVEPTNNAIERLLRQAVLWRKKSCGTRSANGSHYVERVLTVVATCRLQGRNVLEYLTSACLARIRHTAAPSLLPRNLPG
jgi:transposase